MLTTAAMKRRPTTPGEMLLEEYLEPAGSPRSRSDARQRMPRHRAGRLVARAHDPARSVRAKCHGGGRRIA
jgi:plasmid maintenance system antidote protein VapI